MNTEQASKQASKQQETETQRGKKIYNHENEVVKEGGKKNK